jgi:hypothetical protein
MNRLIAVAGLAVFLVACSDTTVPPSLRQAHVAVQDLGIPPPPPVPGSEEGATLDVFGSGESLVAQAVSANSVPPCVDGHNFSPLNFTFTYLLNKTETNEVAHLDLDGANGLTGSIDIHQNVNGGSNANGSISQGGFSFSFQSGDGTIGPVLDDGGNVILLTFDFSLVGILTDPTGAKCQASAELFSHST